MIESGQWGVVKCPCCRKRCDKYSISPFTCMQGEGGTLEQATLAAAAPDLLDACERLVFAADKDKGDGKDCYCCGMERNKHDQDCEIVLAREAIKKAKP